MIKEEKCGITYYFGADPLACCDMDINPGLTTGDCAECDGYQCSEQYVSKC